MTILFNSADDWYEAYEAASEQQQYEMLLQALEQPLSKEFVENMDLGILVVEMHDALVNHNRLAQELEFIDKVREQKPDIYAQEFIYLNSFLVKYHLFLGQPEQVWPALEPYIDDPFHGIDLIFEVLSYLKLYGMGELSEQFCRQLYQPIQQSSELLPGTEFPLGSLITMRHLEQIAHQLQQGASPDWDALATVAQEYGLVEVKKWLADVQPGLTSPVSGEHPEFAQNFKQDQNQVLYPLAYSFCQAMSTQKQMPFVTSYTLWEIIARYWQDRKLPKSHLADPDRYFRLEQEDVLDALEGMMYDWMTMDIVSAFALVWGIPYVYEFLLERQVISPPVCQQAIAVSTDLKTELMNRVPNSLWMFDFVHRWQPPDGVLAEDFTAEVEKFADSFHQQTPLGTTPGHGTVTSRMAAEMGFDKDAEMQKLLNDPKFRSLTGALEESSTAEWDDPGYAKSQFPRSHKKSPLRLAAELEPSKPKDKSSKSTGFSGGKPKKKKGKKGR